MIVESCGNRERGDAHGVTRSTFHGKGASLSASSFRRLRGIRPAGRVREVVEPLDESRVERDDSLGKNPRRVERIRNHPEAVAEITGIDDEDDDEDDYDLP